MPFQVSDVRVDKQVKNLLLAKTNESYLSDIFLPEIVVKDDSGNVPVWGDAHQRTYDLKRSTNDTSLHYVELEDGTDVSYKIEDYDATHKVTTKILEQQEEPYNLLSQAAISAREIVKLNRDVALAATLTSTSILTSNSTLSGTSQWSDFTNSTPYANIETAIETILKNTGRAGNSIYMSHEVATKLRQHPDYINLYGLGGKTVPGGVPQGAFVQLLKDVHNLDNVFIGKTTKITSEEGQTVTRGFVFGKDCVIFYRNPAPSILEPSFGYSFVQANRRLKTKTKLDPTTELFYNVTSMLSFDDKILMPEAAFLYKNAVA